MKKFIITEDEKRRILGLHEGFKKGVLSEQFTKVEGPYKDVGKVMDIDDIYIMKLEKTMCRWDQKNKAQAFGDDENLYRGTMIPMTGATCGEGFTTIPGGKFYLLTQGRYTGGRLEMVSKDNPHFDLTTNMGQGYNTAEEAKKVIPSIFNPQGHVGRQVEKGTDDDGTKYKMVTKYDKEGTIKGVKLNIKNSGGTKTVERTKSGL